MEQGKLLIELEDPLRRLSCGINAMGLMTVGLAQVRDPYADGFHAVWNYLREAEMEIQQIVQSVSE